MAPYARLGLPHVDDLPAPAKAFSLLSALLRDYINHFKVLANMKPLFK